MQARRPTGRALSGAGPTRATRHALRSRELPERLQRGHPRPDLRPGAGSASCPPHANQRLAYLTFAAESREEILALAARYRALVHIERTFHQADLASARLAGPARTWIRMA